VRSMTLECLSLLLAHPVTDHEGGEEGLACGLPLRHFRGSQAVRTQASPEAWVEGHVQGEGLRKPLSKVDLELSLDQW
jgi:hypothetical protein